MLAQKQRAEAVDCTVLQLQDTHAADQKKVTQEIEEVRANMKKTQHRAEEVQGTFDTHNGEYLRMKVYPTCLPGCLHADYNLHLLFEQLLT